MFSIFISDTPPPTAMLTTAVRYREGIEALYNRLTSTNYPPIVPLLPPPMQVFAPSPVLNPPEI